MKPILPKIEVLDSILSFAKKCFSRPQFSHFREYVGGLITLQNKTVSGIATACASRKNQSSLNRFLTVSDWNESELEEKYLQKVDRKLGREKASLVIDDSLSKKTGRHISEVQYHKDHAGNGYVFGHQVVTALVKTREQLLPLFPRLYSKKTQSKIEFAKSLISLANDRLRLKEVIMDSWYMATDVIKLCQKKKLDVIGCLKSNRKASFKPGEWENLSAHFKALKKKDFQSVIIDEETYKVHEAVVRLKHLGMIKLLISQEWNSDEKRWSRPFYLISTNTKKSAVLIIRTYTKRWGIEVFHRDIKQNLGLEACQVRGRKGITRHLILVALAYATLKFWTAVQNTVCSIGEATRQIQT
jgi:SRSO17 transposase